MAWMHKLQFRIKRNEMARACLQEQWNNYFQLKTRGATAPTRTTCFLQLKETIECYTYTAGAHTHTHRYTHAHMYVHIHSHTHPPTHHTHPHSHHEHMENVQWYSNSVDTRVTHVCTCLHDCSDDLGIHAEGKIGVPTLFN